MTETTVIIEMVCRECGHTHGHDTHDLNDLDSYVPDNTECSKCQTGLFPYRCYCDLTGNDDSILFKEGG